MNPVRQAPARRRPLSRCAPLAAVALSGLLLASCAAQGPAAEAEDSADAAEFPVTLEIPGSDESVTIEEEPQRIAVLSPDAAIALQELGAGDRIVAVPESATNDTLNAHAEELSDVPNTVPGETSPEPEQVLAWDPDLIVVTARHTGEQDASEQLSSTGVPVVALANGWSTSDAVLENLSLLGQATGAVDAADDLVAEIRAGLADVRERAGAADGAPSVAILSNQAHVPFINAGSALVSELVVNGGGENVADAVGVSKTMPVQPEQLVAADPDRIMLVDVTGKGEASFDGLLKNPAVADLAAVREGHVKMFPGHAVYGLAGREIVSGSESVLEWLHPELGS